MSTNQNIKIRLKSFDHRMIDLSTKYLTMMNTMQNIRMSFRELLNWLAVAVITIAAFFGTYYFHFSSPIKAVIWIGWFVLTVTLGFFTTKGQEIFLFSKEAKIELQKVVWPNRQETVQTTTIVMAMVAITGFVLWGIDSGMMWAIGKITHLG